MVFINMGDSQESTDGSEIGGLVMDQRSQSSASSYESNPEPPAPLRQGQQRPGRPPFRTQLSEPNWSGPYGPSPVASLLQHHHSSIASPDSELSTESHSTAVATLFAPEHFRHEPFSVFYGTGTGIRSAAAAFCCGQLSSLMIEHGQGDTNAIDRPPTLVPGPFIFSPGACAWLTRLFQQKALSPELREELFGQMLQMHTAHFDKNRRSSLAPNQPDFGGTGPQSGQGQLSPYGPDSLFFCIGQAGSRKNSFAGPSPTAGQQCFFTGGQMMNGSGGGSVATELGQQQGQKQQKRKRAVITMDAQSTQILIASDSVCRLFGFRDRSLIGKKLAEVFPAVKSPWDVPDGTRGPLLLQNVFFADSERQKRLKPVYGKPVDILDADGQRLTLSVWSYPLAGASTAAAAPRKNSAILLRSPSAFLPSFVPFPSTTQSSASPTSANAPNGPSAGEGNGVGRASHLPQATKVAECLSSTKKVSPPALYTHNHSHSNSQQRNLNNLNSSTATLSGQNSTIDLISPTQSQRTLHKSSSSSSTSSQGIPIVGYSPQLKEVLEEEQQQNNFDQKSQPSKSTEAEQKGLAKLPAFELNEPERSAVSSGLHQSTTTKQPKGAEAVFCDFDQQEATTSTATSSQGTTMVQAGVPIRTNPAATNGINNHHSQSNDTYRKESAEEEAIVIIPINRAEMDATNQQTEPHQKGFLRRQYHCEILANTFASSLTNSNKTMAIGRKCTNNNNNNEGEEATITAALTNGQQTQLPQMNGHSSASTHNGQKGGGDGQQQQNDRWLLLMEPLPALFASVILGAKGRIFRVDDAFPAVASILGYESTNRLLGMEIQRLIPSLNIGAEWDAKEQYCCGSTVKHNGVPLMATMKATRDQESGVVFSYEVQIRSIASISGVFMLTEMGTIYSYNENLFHELLGMEFESDEQNKLEITDLIPHFFEYLEVAHFHLRHHQQDNQNQQQNGKEQNNQPHHRHSSTASADQPGPSTSFMPTVSHSSSCLFTQELATARRAFGRRSNSFYGNAMPLMREDQAEDEEQQHGDEQKRSAQHQQGYKRPEIIPGIFYGLIRHVDGMMIPVKIEVSNLENHQSVNGGQRLFAVCIGFDRTMDWGISQLSEEEEQQEEAHQNQQMQKQHEPSPSASNGALGELKKKQFCVYSDSSTTFLVDSAGRPHFSIGGRDCDSESTVDFVAGAIGGKIVTDDFLMHSAEMKLQEVSLGPLEMEDENNEAVRGEYSKHYDTFQLLGNGAFGSVKLAARKDTGLLTVTKFIYKAKVLPESWVPSPKRANRMVPIEVHLLENLNHSNIVRVLDVFENDKYYQLVMEKYGSGMDLFEFIDHKPKLDEPLISYIFRQIVSAVDYLHHNHIVHRDLKDENVIIDQNFCCKLIDFGSAAFFGDGIVFSTFCGTMEYCSPEVLTGNKYLGPELEMWSMGILLYTLVYFENPFRSAQETVHADIELPWEISEGLYQVMNWLLQPDPKLRATVREIKSHWWLTQQVDPRRYSFKELLKNCERAQVVPPLYVSDLHNHLKNGSASCSNLASMSIANQLNAETATTTKNGKADGQPKQQMGIVSAR